MFYIKKKGNLIIKLKSQMEKHNEELNKLNKGDIDNFKRTGMHTMNTMNWLKSRYVSKAKIKYLLFPEQLRKHYDINQLFRGLDLDQSEGIEVSELIKMFKVNNIFLNKKQIDSVFKLIDFNGDNSLNLSEFKHSVFSDQINHEFSLIMRDFRSCDSNKQQLEQSDNSLMILKNPPTNSYQSVAEDKKTICRTKDSSTNSNKYININQLDNNSIIKESQMKNDEQYGLMKTPDSQDKQKSIQSLLKNHKKSNHTNFFQKSQSQKYIPIKFQQNVSCLQDFQRNEAQKISSHIINDSNQQILLEQQEQNQRVIPTSFASMVESFSYNFQRKEQISKLNNMISTQVIQKTRELKNLIELSSKFTEQKLKKMQNLNMKYKYKAFDKLIDPIRDIQSPSYKNELINNSKILLQNDKMNSFQARSKEDNDVPLRTENLISLLTQSQDQPIINLPLAKESIDIQTLDKNINLTYPQMYLTKKEDESEQFKESFFCQNNVNHQINFLAPRCRYKSQDNYKKVEEFQKMTKDKYTNKKDFKNNKIDYENNNQMNQTVDSNKSKKKKNDQIRSISNIYRNCNIFSPEIQTEYPQAKNPLLKIFQNKILTHYHKQNQHLDIQTLNQFSQNSQRFYLPLQQKNHQKDVTFKNIRYKTDDYYFKDLIQRINIDTKKTQHHNSQPLTSFNMSAHEDNLPNNIKNIKTQHNSSTQTIHNQNEQNVFQIQNKNTIFDFNLQTNNIKKQPMLYNDANSQKQIKNKQFSQSCYHPFPNEFYRRSNVSSITQYQNINTSLNESEIFKNQNAMLKYSDQTFKNPSGTLKNSDATQKNLDATQKNSDETLKNSDATLKNSDAKLKNSDVTLKNLNVILKNSDVTFKNQNATLNNSDTTLKNSNVLHTRQSQINNQNSKVLSNSRDSRLKKQISSQTNKTANYFEVNRWMSPYLQKQNEQYYQFQQSERNSGKTVSCSIIGNNIITVGSSDNEFHIKQSQCKNIQQKVQYL